MMDKLFLNNNYPSVLTTEFFFLFKKQTSKVLKNTLFKEYHKKKELLSIQPFNHPFYLILKM